MKTPLNLLLSCVGRRSYIARYFRKNLDQSDRIIGTSSTPWTPAFASCDESILMPPYRTEEYKKRIVHLCQEKNISAIFSFMDEDVEILSSLSNEFQQAGTKPIVPPHHIAELCLDKWKAFQFFKKQGISTAETFIDIKEAKYAIDRGQIKYPLIVKPRFGFGSSHTFTARAYNELSVFFHYQDNMLIQEYMDGEMYNVDLLSDLSGNLISVVPWRKFLSRLGETEQAITVEGPELVDFAVALITALNGHIGPMDVDLFIKHGQVSILEMNPRFGGGYPVTELAGGNFTGKLIAMLRGEIVSPDIGNYDRGVVMMKDLHPVGGLKDIFFADHLHIKPTERTAPICN